jgi:hypothetical protein
MLPNPDHLPTDFVQLPVRVLIPLNIPLDLGAPPLRVRCGHTPMFRAPVPKAPVDENCDLRLPEADIRLSPRPRPNRLMQPKPQAARMKQGTKGPLDLVVRSFRRTHSSSDSITAGRWSAPLQRHRATGGWVMHMLRDRVGWDSVRTQTSTCP